MTGPGQAATTADAVGLRARARLPADLALHRAGPMRSLPLPSALTRLTPRQTLSRLVNSAPARLPAPGAGRLVTSRAASASTHPAGACTGLSSSSTSSSSTFVAAPALPEEGRPPSSRNRRRAPILGPSCTGAPCSLDIGAGGRIRTDTDPVDPADFKSAVAAVSPPRPRAGRGAAPRRHVTSARTLVLRPGSAAGARGEPIGPRSVAMLGGAQALGAGQGADQARRVVDEDG